MWREDGTGENGRVEGDVGAPLVVALPSLRKKRAYGTAGVRARCSDSSEKCSARASSNAKDGKKRTGSCVGIGVASVQGRPGRRTGEGKAEYKADGGRIADGS